MEAEDRAKVQQGDGKSPLNYLEILFDGHTYNDPWKPICMFDGLKPGVYGLSCPCPRCSATCGSVGDATGYTAPMGTSGYIKTSDKIG
jgi:hypothetical protein